MIMRKLNKRETVDDSKTTIWFWPRDGNWTQHFRHKRQALFQLRYPCFVFSFVLDIPYYYPKLLIHNLLFRASNRKAFLSTIRTLDLGNKVYFIFFNITNVCMLSLGNQRQVCYVPSLYWFCYCITKLSLAVDFAFIFITIG